MYDFWSNTNEWLLFGKLKKKLIFFKFYLLHSSKFFSRQKQIKIVKIKKKIIISGYTILFIYEETARTCVASEYGVGELSSTSCEPNIGGANLLSDEESMMRIVSCLGTMLQLLCCYYFIKRVSRCGLKNTRRTYPEKKNNENAQKKNL